VPLLGSAHPLCRWPNSSALRDFARWTPLETVKSPAIPLREFRLRVGHCPVPPSRILDEPCSGSSRGLLLPFSTCSNEGPLIADFAYPLGSALRVWLPSRRLTPFEASPALFRAGSALGKFPFGAFSSQEVPERFRASELTYRFTQRVLRRQRRQPGPMGRGS